MSYLIVIALAYLFALIFIPLKKISAAQAWVWAQIRKAKDKIDD